MEKQSQFTAGSFMLGPKCREKRLMRNFNIDKVQTGMKSTETEHTEEHKSNASQGNKAQVRAEVRRLNLTADGG